MIIGTTQVSLLELQKHIDSARNFMLYAEALVPERYRHVKEIVDNQVYYNLLIIRKAESIQWKIKKDLIDEVMGKIFIKGFMDVIFDVATLETQVNMVKVHSFV